MFAELYCVIVKTESNKIAYASLDTIQFILKLSKA